MFNIVIEKIIRLVESHGFSVSDIIEALSAAIPAATNQVVDTAESENNNNAEPNIQVPEGEQNQSILENELNNTNQPTPDADAENADKGEKPFTAEELQAFEKQEIIDLIKAIEADYQASISNITKDKLVQKYLEITAQ